MCVCVCAAVVDVACGSVAPLSGAGVRVCVRALGLQLCYWSLVLGLWLAIAGSNTHTHTDRQTDKQTASY